MDRFKIGAAVAAMVALLTFLGVMLHMHEKVDPTVQASVVAVITASIAALVRVVSGAAQSNATTKDDDTKGTPPHTLAALLTVGSIVGSALVGCSPAAKHAAAEAEYANEDARCVDALKPLPPDAGALEYNVEWASFEGCLADVRARWTDGGAK